MRLSEFVRKLKNDCSTVEATVLQQHLADEPTLKAVRPGGKDNPDKSPYGWLTYYRWLHRRHAVNEIHQQATRSEGGGADDGTVLDALRGKPERVELLAPFMDGEEQRATLMVHPKAFAPLIYCHLLSIKLGWLGAHIRALGASTAPGDRDVIVQAWARVGRLHRQLLWAVTAPGPRLPFDADETPDPDPPTWCQAVDALDLHRVIQAYQRVHGARLIALDRLIPAPDDAPGKSLWSTFATGAAEALGISTDAIANEVNFPAIVARLRVSANAQREAMDRARAKSEAKRRSRE